MRAPRQHDTRLPPGMLSRPVGRGTQVTCPIHGWKHFGSSPAAAAQTQELLPTASARS